MKIMLNGSLREMDEAISIGALLAELKLSPEHVAVELNGELVERADFERLLAERDRLEVVRFVGGG